MASIIRIATAANTLAPAWLAILEKGYEVTKQLIGERELFLATKGDLEFIAEDTVALLGLIGMYEARGENWKATDAEIDAYMVLDES